MPSSSKEHKTLPRCTFQARLQHLSPLLGRRRHRSLSSPKTRGSVPHLPCHGHPGMRTQRIKRLAKVPLTSPSPTATPRCPCPRRQRRGPIIPAEQSFFGVGGGTGEDGAVFPKKRPFLPRQKLHPSLPKLPAAHAPALRPQWRVARRPCPPQPCGRRCGRQPGAPPG